MACHSLRLLQAMTIRHSLQTPATNESIKLAGLYLLGSVADDSDRVLVVARHSIESYHFQHVPSHWRRLYEEASLHKAAAILESEAGTYDVEHKSKRQRVAINDDRTAQDDEHDDWLQGLVKVLDQSMMLTGAPGRRRLYDDLFQQLQMLVPDDHEGDVPSLFRIDAETLPPCDSDAAIERTSTPLSLDSFETWMQRRRQPVITPKAFDFWPACQSWQDPRYLLKQTLGGRRIVPVEIGESYTCQDWTQRTMTMKEFMLEYLLPEKSENVGYLAQYDIFQQIPALRADVSVPDYCYTDPPATDGDALRTSGLAAIAPVDEPLMHAWLGPKGTKTPLHTDPYHNIFCQVVGYKYVRLYAPGESRCLYPKGLDESGINMDNTSSIDVRFLSRSEPETDADKLQQFREDFPLFENATFVEGVLGPGDTLYVPLGWWHYVESLTTSFSVSFWWN